MARPRRYRTVSTKTENEVKRKAITPRTMPVVACLMTDEKEEETLHNLFINRMSKLQKTCKMSSYPEYRGDPKQSPIPGP